ncbi:MAG: hypothetical protein QY323_04390 [Patescibacteria group bacterium]|nr:MAG: hypothetical protein QY323_04390 [Patescibacteria group bacterium]
MKSAMVIMGHHSCFSAPGRSLIDFLKRVCRIRYVVGILAAHRDADDLRSVIAIHATRAERQPFLLAYIGHGWDDGWYYGKVNKKVWHTLGYDGLERILKERRGPTLVLNDTCRSGSLVERVRAWKEPHEASVIAATSPKGTAMGEMTVDLIKSWREHKTYEPRRREYIPGRAFWERRAGLVHDRHFFPKPA